jgi:hypothetical protein
VKRGAESATHKKTIHPVNKYGNTKDEVSKTDGPASTASFRMKNSGYLIAFAFVGLLLYSNLMSGKTSDSYNSEPIPWYGGRGGNTYH